MKKEIKFLKKEKEDLRSFRWNAFPGLVRDFSGVFIWPATIDRQQSEKPEIVLLSKIFRKWSENKQQ